MRSPERLPTLLADSLRAQDKVARWGGEEFVMLLKDTDASGAVAIAERIRLTIAGTPFHVAVKPFK